MTFLITCFCSAQFLLQPLPRSRSVSSDPSPYTMSTFFTFLACIIWMVSTVFSLPTGHRTGDDDTKSISVPVGSSLYVSETKLCQDTNNRRYELHYKNNMIASCDGGHCEGLMRFINRVKFIQENCTLLVEDITIEDAGVYTLITQTTEDDKPKAHKTVFNIIVKENISVPPVTHVPNELNELTGNITANVPGFIYVCLSMAPLGNAICYLLHRFLYWLANKNRNGTKITSLSRASNFIQGDRFQIGVKKGLSLGGIISLICQVVSIVWSFLPEYKYNPVFLIIAIVCLVIPIVDLAFNLVIPIVDLAFKSKPCPACFSLWKNETERTGSECKQLQNVLEVWFYIQVLTQMAFTACIVIHFHNTYGEIDRQMAGHLFAAFLISLVVHLVCLLACFYCSPPKTNEEKKPEETHMMERHPPNDGESSSLQQRDIQKMTETHPEDVPSLQATKDDQE